MKKSIYFFTTLICSVLFANTAKAADELIVAGVTVNTSATGIQTISSSAIQKLDPSKSVLVAYIPTQKKLGFKNAKIVNTAASGTNVIVQSNIAGLTIAIEDSCFLGVSRGVPMAVTANTTIEGYGTNPRLEMNSGNLMAIATNGGNLTIKDISLTATGKQKGIQGANGTETLTVNNANVTIGASSDGAITGFGAMEMTYCGITQPSGAVFRETSKGVVALSRGLGGKLSFNIVKSQVVIEKEQLYDVWVAGVQLSNLNCNKITTGVTAGKVSYDPETTTLTLDNATISVDSEYAIINKIDGVKINLVGENSIWAAYNDAIYSDSFLWIQGEGSVTIEGHENQGIFLDRGSDLEIRNTTITNVNGIYTDDVENNVSIIINNSYVKVTENGLENISYFISKDCKIIEPADVMFDDRAYTVVIDGTTEKVNEFTVGNGYPLWIAGEKVYADEATDIKRAGKLTAGTVTYDDATKTLTLNGATINGDKAIRSEIDSLTINLVGENSCLGEEVIIDLDAPASILGSGSLNITSENDIAIQFVEKLTVTNATLNIKANVHAFEGSAEKDTLVFNNATIKYNEGETYGAFVNMVDELTLTDCRISQPAGATLSEGILKLDGNNVDGEVIILPTIYNLWIDGKQVTELTAADIRGDGKVSYDNATQTLTLDNATINSTATCISSEINGLTIDLKGENKLSGGDEAIYTKAPTTITGEGSLVAESTIAIYCGQSEITGVDNVLTILNTTVTAIGSDWGITGDAVRETLIIENSTVKATGTNEGSINDFVEITLNDCSITTEGATLNAAKTAVVDAEGNVIKTEVLIAPIIKYDLYIEGEQVTELTAADIRGDGKVSYDNATQTLTLDNVTINSTATCISSKINGLTIDLKGENKLSGGGEAIYTRAPTTITGEGSLVAESTIAIYCGESAISGVDNVLTILNTTVTAIGSDWGITGDAVRETLIIENSTVKATGTNEGSINDFVEITLNDCSITTEGATLNAAKTTVVDAEGNVIKTEVLIEPTETAIRNIELTGVYAREGRIFGAGNARIYDVIGRDVTHENGSLKGVFVVKTENAATKIVVR